MVSWNAVVMRKGTRAPEEPVKHQISNSLCFLITFRASKASRGYSMSGEVGWHLNSNILQIMHELSKVNGGTVNYLKG